MRVRSGAYHCQSEQQYLEMAENDLLGVFYKNDDPIEHCQNQHYSSTSFSTQKKHNDYCNPYNGFSYTNESQQQAQEDAQLTKRSNLHQYFLNDIVDFKSCNVISIQMVIICQQILQIKQYLIEKYKFQLQFRQYFDRKYLKHCFFENENLQKKKQCGLELIICYKKQQNTFENHVTIFQHKIWFIDPKFINQPIYKSYLKCCHYCYQIINKHLYLLKRRIIKFHGQNYSTKKQLSLFFLQKIESQEKQMYQQIFLKVQSIKLSSQLKQQQKQTNFINDNGKHIDEFLDVLQYVQSQSFHFHK